MKLLYYKGLDYQAVKGQFEKTVDFLATGDFRSADVKKLISHNYYRAKLDIKNRLLFKIGSFENEKYILLLEVIYNHEYDKSRFLRGAVIDENKLEAINLPDQVKTEDIVKLNYINRRSQKFHLLDKILSFDNIQEEIFSVKPPVIIIGSAGSGKTALTLEKIKNLKGNILYITLSPYLAENSSKLYYSNNYINEDQELDFLYFKEFLDTLHIINEKELTFRIFDSWIQTRIHSFGLKDSHKLFEEIRGVITGMDVTKPYLTENEYINLGVKQTIYLQQGRNKVYEVFNKYLEFLKENNYYDLNIITYKWLELCKPSYDFIVIDEVQDFTNIQLFILLKSLNTKGSFMLCGDSNQVVHPNFFSWTKVKTMFYQQDLTGNELKILRTNYRNSTDITELANRLLKIKNARFGSIDKESTYLIEAIAGNTGNVILMNDDPKTRSQLNEKTSRSTNFAILVMKQEDKQRARSLFKSPLLFSIQEAKGLEYENVILLNFISDNSNEFHEICNGVEPEHLVDDAFLFSRGKDKTDKSLDAFKFYINSLYVAITRAVKNIYILESSQKHRLLKLLELVETKDHLNIKAEVSSSEDWKKEALKLEKQGKTEQADEIRKSYLGIQIPDWTPITPDNIEELKKEALDPDNFNKKAKDKLFSYSLLYNDVDNIRQLSALKYRKADEYEKERQGVFRKYYPDYQSDNLKAIEQNIRKWGINYRDQFNMTPLLIAIQTGSKKILDFILANQPDTSLSDNTGKNPLRIAIFQAFLNKASVRNLAFLYPKLVTENIKIKIDNKLVKIDNHKFEYFLLNLFICLHGSVKDWNKDNFSNSFGMSAANITDIIYNYPDNVLQDYRKKQTYISAMLSKNEINSNNPYNKKLLFRTTRGYYALNPELEVMVNENWKNVYDLMAQNKDQISTEENRSKNFISYMQEHVESLKHSDPEMYRRLKNLDKSEDDDKTSEKKQKAPSVNEDQLKFPF